MTSFANLKPTARRPPAMIYVGSYTDAGNLYSEAPEWHPGSAKNDPTGMGFYPRGLELARQTGASCTTVPPPICWTESPGTRSAPGSNERNGLCRGRARLWSGDRSEVSDRVPPVHHERRRRRRLFSTR